MNKKIKQYSNLVLGSSLLALGIYLFVTPNNINFGGVIGLSQIIDYFLSKTLNISNKVGIINFLINVPLFLFALKIMNKEFCFKTIVSLIIQTLILSVLPPLKAPLVDDILLNCLFGAMVCGMGVGIALRSSGCCGGIDIACMCIVKKHPDFKTGQLSIYINAVLFSICFFIFDLQTTMYSIVFVAILYTVADKYHDQNINVAALIITDHDEIKEIIMKQMGRGVTFWHGFGAYTGNSKQILFCAVNKYEISEIRHIVTDNDPKAFITFFEGPMIRGGFEKRL
ncbi:MAG: YitT family protein [Erysipelotrichaceae bacterium]|nr:YitT family protein [Erysipelotrichaceae bacterium]